MYNLLLIAATLVSLPFSFVQAAAPTDYQVTGPILELTDTTVTVQKGKENWEIARAAATPLTGGTDLKVGDKVTIHYTMSAKSIEVKPAAAKKK